MSYFSLRQAMPGSSRPSRNSREVAPPPVEIWVILSANPVFSTAQRNPPPPMMEIAPLSYGLVAHADGTGGKVFPLGNAHRAVPDHGARALDGFGEGSMVFGPISSPIQPSGNIVRGDCHGLSVGLYSLPTLLSRGRRNFTPFFPCIFHGSLGELQLFPPHRWRCRLDGPLPFRKVYAMPPPMIRCRPC